MCPGLVPIGDPSVFCHFLWCSRPVAECIDPSPVLVSPSQSFAWSSCSEWSVGLRVPFVVDVCSGTFEQLDLLLRQVSEGMDGSADWPPPQEKECMAVATLNLLRLQVGEHLCCGRGVSVLVGTFMSGGCGLLAGRAAKKMFECFSDLIFFFL